MVLHHHPTFPMLTLCDSIQFSPKYPTTFYCCGGSLLTTSSSSFISCPSRLKQHNTFHSHSTDSTCQSMRGMFVFLHSTIASHVEDSSIVYHRVICVIYIDHTSTILSTFLLLLVPKELSNKTDVLNLPHPSQQISGVTKLITFYLLDF